MFGYALFHEDRYLTPLFPTPAYQILLIGRIWHNFEEFALRSTIGAYTVGRCVPQKLLGRLCGPPSRLSYFVRN